ncbi:MAG: helix-turn-helix domain-containing protein [Lachnospiraceae bacterium]|nr:helix-turn-helix domain-containing protein [Lachnospiraceae bacterium]
MQNLKPIIAKNISNLRQQNNMTQGDLADKLNYSDKAISKWERAESIPDVAVLKKIADLFEVTLDYLVSENNEKIASETDTSINAETKNASPDYKYEQEEVSDSEKSDEANMNKTIADNISPDKEKSNSIKKLKFIYMSSPLRKHGFITGICIILAWLLATLAFVLMDIFTNDNYYHWLFFIYAIPVSCIIWLVFNSLWFNKRRNYFIISLLMWSSLASIVLSLLPFGNKMLLIFVLGIPGQVIIYMWSNLKKKVELSEDEL